MRARQTEASEVYLSVITIGEIERGTAAKDAAFTASLATARRWGRLSVRIGAVASRQPTMW